MKAPAAIETERLLLQRPRAEDASAVFERYASDPEVTRYLGWPTHGSLADTEAFLAFSDAEWERWPAGPYLVRSRDGGLLLGGTGLAFLTPRDAATGYVFAKDAWGRGYATEALHAMVGLAARTGVRTLHALCHPDHRASWRVLEKCGFVRDGERRPDAAFPNLEGGTRTLALRYAMSPRG